MTTLLPQIHTDAVPPNNIANLTQKVKKHLSTGKEEDEFIKSLFPPKEDPNKISDYCTSVGIAADILHSSEYLDISSKLLTKELIYDLEKYRQKNRFPWSEAVKWQSKIFHSDPSYSISEVNIVTKWNRNYDKITGLMAKHKLKYLNNHLSAPYIPPVRTMSAKECMMDTFAHPPMEQINASPVPLLAMAEFQGEVMGTYVHKLERNQAKQEKKIQQLKTKLETITEEKDELENQKQLHADKIKDLQSKVDKTQSELADIKEKVTCFKTRNVKQREGTKVKQIYQLNEKTLVMKKELARKDKELSEMESISKEMLNKVKEENFGT